MAQSVQTHALGLGVTDVEIAPLSASNEWLRALFPRSLPGSAVSLLNSPARCTMQPADSMGVFTCDHGHRRSIIAAMFATWWITKGHLSGTIN